MAFGDPLEEGACLLPGGSRVEALDVQNLTKHSSKRVRFSTAILACSVAVAACIAVLTVQNFGTDSSTVLLEGPTVQSNTKPANDPLALASSSHLPSWLQTGPVKLMPLDRLIREQEIVHQMAEGKVSEKLYKQEHMKEGPSPHQLAMHSVHVLAQEKQRRHEQLAQKSFHHHSAQKRHKSEDPAVKKAVHALHEKARGMHQRKEKGDSSADEKQYRRHLRNEKDDTPVDEKHQSHEVHHAHVRKIGGVVKVHNVAEELEKDEDLLAMIKKGELSQEAAIKKQELHRLAALKRKDGLKEVHLEKQIKLLENKVAEQKNSHQESSSATSLIREKAKLKAEMARVEEEEQKKLEALKAELDQVAGSKSRDHKSPTTELASKPSKVHSAAVSTASDDSEAPQHAMKKPACTKDDCNLDHEDKKWLAHKKSVDYYAKIALTGHGAAKRDAVEKMKELEHQITHDFHHVTSFAVAQEYALPPPPK